MKKSLLIVGLLGCILLCGCGKKQPAQQEQQKQQETQTQAPAEVTATEAPAATLAPSTNKTVVAEEEAPKVYWAMDIAYHLKDCKTLSGQKPQEVPWSLVKEIGLRQCPECNPPQYEGYVEAE